MALAHTDRGDTQNGQGNGSTRTVASASFTPALGALVTLCGYLVLDDTHALSNFTPTNTGFVVDAWTERVTRSMTDGGNYSLRVGIWTGKVTTSAAGVVTLTRPASTTNWNLFLQVDEWNGQHTSPIGLSNSADDARASGTTLTVGFGGTPTASSGAVGLIGDNNGVATGAVAPTGWTESADVGLTETGNSADSGWRLTSVQASPQWTALQSGNFGKIGAVLEILEAAGSSASATAGLASVTVTANNAVATGTAHATAGNAAVTATASNAAATGSTLASAGNAAVTVTAGTAAPTWSGKATAGNAAVTVTANSATASSVVYYLDDEFSGSSVDSTIWTVYNRLGDQVNNEVNAVIPANARVSSGTLKIDSKFEDVVAGDTTTGAPNPRTVHYTSAQLGQAYPSFLYGTVEVRAKICGGTGAWPCIWMLGHEWQASQPFTANVAGADWPNDGWWEIDIAEFLSDHRTLQNCQLHFITASRGGSGEKSIPFDATTRFMVYRLEWTATSLVWKIDAEDGVGFRTLLTITGTAGTDIPNTPGYLILHTAIGGVGATTPDSSTFPVTTEIDYARITSGSALCHPTVASVTVTANSPAPVSSSHATAGNASVTVTANNAVVKGTATATAGLASVTVTAGDAGGSASFGANASAGNAAVTVTAGDTTTKLSGSATAGNAAVAVAAYDAAPTVPGQVNAAAGLATVTVTAGTSTGTATAHATAGLASVTISALDASGSGNATATGGLATVTTTAAQPSNTVSLAALAAAALVIATAYNIASHIATPGPFSVGSVTGGHDTPTATGGHLVPTATGGHTP